MQNNQERKTKYCQNCGAEIDVRAEVCPDCGVRIMPDRSQFDTEQVSKAYKQMYPSMVKTSLKYVIPIILGTFLLVYAIMWFILPLPP